MHLFVYLVFILVYNLAYIYEGSAWHLSLSFCKVVLLLVNMSFELHCVSKKSMWLRLRR